MLIVNDEHRMRAGMCSLEERCPYCGFAFAERVCGKWYNKSTNTYRLQVPLRPMKRPQSQHESFYEPQTGHHLECCVMVQSRKTGSQFSPGFSIFPFLPLHKTRYGVKYRDVFQSRSAVSSRLQWKFLVALELNRC